MKLGVTGSATGGTLWQEDQLRQVLVNCVPAEFHHGDCIGIDALGHAIMLELREKFTEIKIHIHPPDSPAQRAFCQSGNVYHPEKPYLDRDRDVARVDVLVAVVPTVHEVLRSGTWATVRYARKYRYPLIIRINPDETISFG